jgi:predicted nucleotidyltransferase
MSQSLTKLSKEVHCSERTLRRGVRRGLIKAHGIGTRNIELPRSEEEYVRSHWHRLSGLQTGLRTERSVRLAVLFGSVATGTDTDKSDIDILVVLSGSDVLGPIRLSRRLNLLSERKIQIVTLDQARTSPSLLTDVLEEGRVLIDRDGLWFDLKKNEPVIKKEAIAAEREITQGALTAIAEASARLRHEKSET